MRFAISSLADTRSRFMGKPSRRIQRALACHCEAAQPLKQSPG